MTSDASPPRSSRRRTDTRRRLLAAADQLLASRAFWQISIEDVCTTAGFTRGAFYSNFESLDELFLDLWQGRTDAVVGEISAALRSPSAETSFEDLVRRVVSLLPLDVKWARLRCDYVAHGAHKPEIAERLARDRQELAGDVATHLGSLVQLLPASPGRPLADIAEAVIVALDGVLVRLALDEDEQAALGRMTRHLELLLT